MVVYLSFLEQGVCIRKSGLTPVIEYSLKMFALTNKVLAVLLLGNEHLGGLFGRICFRRDRVM